MEYETIVNLSDGTTIMTGHGSLRAAKAHAIEHHADDPDSVQTIEIWGIIRHGKFYAGRVHVATLPDDKI